MFKKTLLALATVVALAGFGSLGATTPADAAQTVHRLPPRMHAAPVHHRIAPAHAVPRAYYVRHHHRHHRLHRSTWWYGSGMWLYPPGVYGYYDDCRVVRKRVRVLTDHGWRWRLRKVTYCYYR